MPSAGSSQEFSQQVRIIIAAFITYVCPIVESCHLFTILLTLCKADNYLNGIRPFYQSLQATVSWSPPTKRVDSTSFVSFPPSLPSLSLSLFGWEGARVLAPPPTSPLDETLKVLTCYSCLIVCTKYCEVQLHVSVSQLSMALCMCVVYTLE